MDKDKQMDRVQKIPIQDLIPFKDHPFRVVEDESMLRTTESISMFGVLTPLIARPAGDGKYEIISGHRRAHAAEAVGLTEVPVIVRDMDDDVARTLVVDSNLQRENILPSERAFAYKMKADAMKHQGERTDLQQDGTSGQVVPKYKRTTEAIGAETGDSYNTIQRFIRLTNLIPELLEMLDQKKISFNPAVELSYLKPEEQRNLIEAMNFTQAAPSLSQAMRLKKLSQEGSCQLDDMREMLPDLIAAVARKFKYSGSALRSEPVRPASIFNSSKVSDHHAIIPTKTMAESDFSELSLGEMAVMQLISARLLCAVAEDYRYTESTVKSRCGAEEFTKKGRTDLQLGWKAIWQHFYPDKKKDEDSIGQIPGQGNRLQIDSSALKEGKTSPSKHFTEDTLLSAMETAGADETPEEAERKGLGTPATRAATIEKLVQRGFIERKGDKKTKHLIATDKGNALITVMPEQIQSPSMTAEWEQKLLGIEHGEYDAADFMDGISGMIAGLVTTYEKAKGADALMSRNKVIGTCPHCGSEVLEKQKGWFCSNSECRFILWKDNAYFTKIGKRLTSQIVEKLLKDGRAWLKDCKSQKTGKTYNADILLSTEADGRPQFSMEFDKRKGGGK